jgi:hypothetical protein
MSTWKEFIGSLEGSRSGSRCHTHRPSGRSSCSYPYASFTKGLKTNDARRRAYAQGGCVQNQENPRMARRVEGQRRTRRTSNPNNLTRAQVKHLAEQGRYGDTRIAQIGPKTAKMMDRLVHGGHTRKNPRTGLKEYGRHQWMINPPQEGEDLEKIKKAESEEQKERAKRSDYNIKLGNRHDLLKYYGSGMPRQVGGTCALQNGYLAKEFIESLEDIDGKLIGDSIMCNDLKRTIMEEKEKNDISKFTKYEIEELKQKNKKINDAFVNKTPVHRKHLLYSSDYSNFDPGDYNGKRDISHEDIPIQNRQKPREEVRDYVNQINSNPLYDSYRGLNNEATNLKQNLEDSYIHPEIMGKDRLLKDKLQFIHENTKKKGVPVLFSSKVRYGEQSPGSHAMTFLSVKKYSPESLDKKIKKYENEIKNKEYGNDFKTKKLKSTLSALNFMKDNPEYASHRGRVYDSNVDYQHETSPIHQQVVVDDFGRAYRAEDLEEDGKGMIKPKPFFKMEDVDLYAPEKYEDQVEKLKKIT